MQMHKAKVWCQLISCCWVPRKDEQDISPDSTDLHAYQQRAFKGNALVGNPLAGVEE